MNTSKLLTFLQRNPDVTMSLKWWQSEGGLLLSVATGRNSRHEYLPSSAINDLDIAVENTAKRFLHSATRPTANHTREQRLESCLWALHGMIDDSPNIRDIAKETLQARIMNTLDDRS